MDARPVGSSSISSAHDPPVAAGVRQVGAESINVESSGGNTSEKSEDKVKRVGCQRAGQSSSERVGTDWCRPRTSSSPSSVPFSAVIARVCVECERVEGVNGEGDEERA